MATRWCQRTGELVVAWKNHTTYYSNNFILGFHNTHISHVLWPNIRIMHITPLSTSKIMIFEVCKLNYLQKILWNFCWDYFPSVIIIRKCGGMTGHKIELTYTKIYQSWYAIWNNQDQLNLQNMIRAVCLNL